MLAISLLACSEVSFEGESLKLVEKEIDVILGVDVLFILDNSGSMAEEHRNLSEKINGFLQIVKHLDYRVAVTTTDVSNRRLEGRDGSLMPMHEENEIYHVDTSYPIESAQVLLGSTFVSVGTSGSAEERGIVAAYRTLERYAGQPKVLSLRDQKVKSFFRPRAHLVMVVITDSNEPQDWNRKGLPRALLSYKKSIWPEKTFLWNSIVVRGGLKGEADHYEPELKSSLEDDVLCRKQGEAFGVQYTRLSLLTNGIIGSVCSSNYAVQLKNIADRVVEVQKTVQLSCHPQLASENTALVEVLVEVDGQWQPYTNKYTVQGRNLIFDGPHLPEGRYKFKYSCGR